ncbi:MAG: SHOCT domain-containing protein [Thermoleophilaceae bacterium]
MVIAADYPFLDILGTMLIVFAWVIWFYLLIIVFGDLFRRHDISGWGKAGWTVLVIIFPFIGVLLYLGTQGSHMAERAAKDVQAQQQQFDSYVKDVAGGPATEIAKAQELLDKGAITQDEFAQIKTRALTAA